MSAAVFPQVPAVGSPGLAVPSSTRCIGHDRDGIWRLRREGEMRPAGIVPARKGRHAVGGLVETEAGLPGRCLRTKNQAGVGGLGIARPRRPMPSRLVFAEEKTEDGDVGLEITAEDRHADVRRHRLVGEDPRLLRISTGEGGALRVDHRRRELAEEIAADDEDEMAARPRRLLAENLPPIGPSAEYRATASGLRCRGYPRRRGSTCLAGRSDTRAREVLEPTRG